MSPWSSWTAIGPWISGGWRRGSSFTRTSTCKASPTSIPSSPPRDPMLTLNLPGGESDVLSILCVGAHCDDIEIGCGGTLLELAAQRRVRVTWLILSSDPERGREA